MLGRTTSPKSIIFADFCIFLRPTVIIISETVGQLPFVDI
nr:MAG TPA_asm: hypothetical protein [Caudoviricetes sp.]